ncbi:MAG: hypothetical protein L0Y56_07445 [Nitrospira sp.]|nr:hypothetical protein [Nitrospira sp.]
MNSLVANFIQIKRIDSFQKLRLLLFLYQHPMVTGTSQEFAEWLYLADVLLLDKILADLHMTDLVDYIEGYYTLHDEPTVTSELQRLAKAFENPLARQELLDQVRPSISWQSLLDFDRFPNGELWL